MRRGSLASAVLDGKDLSLSVTFIMSSVLGFALDA